MTHAIRSIRILLPVLVILLSIPTLSFAGQYKCTRVVDGDTIKVTGNGNQLTIRLVGIDAPEKSRKKNEPGQPFSQKASKYLAGLVLNKMVRIESYGEDRYGRLLGVVYVNATNVNLGMVKVGLAEVYRGRPAPGFDNNPYWEAEEEARKNVRGMWVQGDNYISPRGWRRLQAATN